MTNSFWLIGFRTASDDADHRTVRRRADAARGRASETDMQVVRESASDAVLVSRRATSRGQPRRPPPRPTRTFTAAESFQVYLPGYTGERQRVRCHQFLCGFVNRKYLPRYAGERVLGAENAAGPVFPELLAAHTYTCTLLVFVTDIKNTLTTFLTAVVTV